MGDAPTPPEHRPSKTALAHRQALNATSLGTRPTSSPLLLRRMSHLIGGPVTLAQLRSLARGGRSRRRRALLAHLLLAIRRPTTALLGRTILVARFRRRCFVRSSHGSHSGRRQPNQIANGLRLLLPRKDPTNHSVALSFMVSLQLLERLARCFQTCIELEELNQISFVRIVAFSRDPLGFLALSPCCFLPRSAQLSTTRSGNPASLSLVHQVTPSVLRFVAATPSMVLIAVAAGSADGAQRVPSSSRPTRCGTARASRHR